jgi:beta-xylosidase
MSLAIAFALSAAAPATYRNPVLYADYSDPDVIRVGRDYYLAASTFHFSPGLPILHSRDLVHWSIVGHVLPKLTFAPEYDMPGPFQLTDATSKPTTGTRYAGGVWAPSIRHHKGLFYIYWPTPDEGIFMATARNPAGPWSKPVTVIAGPGYEDPCPFWDDDGTAWLIHGMKGAGPLILHRMSADGKRVLDDGVVVAKDPERLPVLEGPKLYKRHGFYYIFAPIGGVGTGPQAVGRARSITGPYEWRDVLKPSDTIAGPHQGGYVETPDGKGWFIHFNQTGAFGRIDYLEPVRWVDDWPVMGDAAGQPVTRYAMPAPATRERLQDSDEFASAKLGLQWSWNHNPDDAAWSLTARPGFLRLQADKADYLVTARNSLTQILQGPSSVITARMDVSHMADGERAGLSMFGVGPSWIGVVRAGGTNRVTLSIAGKDQSDVAVTHATIDLRVAVGADQKASYSYSFDGGRNFVRLGDKVPLSPFSWWKGSRPALFTYNIDKAAGWIDVDWVHVETANPNLPSRLREGL